MGIVSARLWGVVTCGNHNEELKGRKLIPREYKDMAKGGSKSHIQDSRDDEKMGFWDN